MKRYMKYKQFIVGIVALGVLIAGGVAVSPVAHALPPVNHFAAPSCPSGQVALKVDKKWQHDSTTCCPNGTNKSASTCLFGKYINPFVNLLAALVGLAVVGGIIYGGILFSSSAGDPQKAAQGKEHIRNALIALLAYILLYTFLQFLIPGGRFNA